MPDYNFARRRSESMPFGKSRDLFAGQSLASAAAAAIRFPWPPPYPMYPRQARAVPPQRSSPSPSGTPLLPSPSEALRNARLAIADGMSAADDDPIVRVFEIPSAVDVGVAAVGLACTAARAAVVADCMEVTSFSVAEALASCIPRGNCAGDPSACRRRNATGSGIPACVTIFNETYKRITR